MMMLKPYFQEHYTEAGLDEAGRGCLAGPVFAAAVILPKDYFNERLNDSKKLSKKVREQLREEIETEAIDYAVSSVDQQKIDEINIHNASYLAMHQAVLKLKNTPQLLLVDGNRFNPMDGIRHQCIIKGDGLYFSIAAASILAKTYRDDFMKKLAKEFPDYAWERNAGYGTKQHVEAILKHGRTPYHRKTFQVKAQLRLGL